MSTQESVLGTSSVNKQIKKAVGKNSKGRKRARSIEEDRYNAALELSIEEEKENDAALSQRPERGGEDHFDLAMEEHSSEDSNMRTERDPSSQNTYVLKTPNNASTISLLDPCTPTKSRSVSTLS